MNIYKIFGLMGLAVQGAVVRATESLHVDKNTTKNINVATSLDYQDESISDLEYGNEVSKLGALDQQNHLDAFEEDTYDKNSFSTDAQKSEHEFILNALRIDKNVIFKLSDKLKNDPDFILEALKIDSEVIFYVTDELKNNSDFMLEALKIDKDAILSASSELKNNSDFMLKGIKINKKALYHISDELKNNPDFLLEASKITDISIILRTMNHIGYQVRNQPDLMFALLKADSINGRQYLSADLKNNFYFMLEALEIDKNLISYASDELKNNPDFMLKASKIIDILTMFRTMDDVGYQVRNNPNFMYELLMADSFKGRKYLSDDLKNNFYFMLEALKVDKNLISYASDELRNNSDFMLDALKIYKYAINCASAELRNNFTFMLEALKVDKDLIVYASAELVINSDFMLEALEIDKDLISYISDELKNTPDFMLAALNVDKDLISYISDELKNTPDFMLEALKVDKDLISYASDVLKNDCSFMLEALKLNDGVVYDDDSFSSLTTVLRLISLVRREAIPMKDLKYKPSQNSLILASTALEAVLLILTSYMLAKSLMRRRNYKSKPRVNYLNFQKIKDAKYEGEINQKYCCNITFDLMDAPVFIEEFSTAIDGQTISHKFYFDKNAIEHWFRTQRSVISFTGVTNPMTNLPCINGFKEDLELKNEIDAWVSDTVKECEEDRSSILSLGY